MTEHVLSHLLFSHEHDGMNFWPEGCWSTICCYHHTACVQLAYTQLPGLSKSRLFPDRLSLYCPRRILRHGHDS